VEHLSPPTPEPSVLDWLKSLFRLKPIAIPERPSANPVVIAPRKASPTVPAAARSERLDLWLWARRLRLPLALLLAFIAQSGLAEHESVRPNIVLYLIAGGLIGWSVRAGELDSEISEANVERARTRWVHPPYLLGAIGMATLAYLAAGDNTFRLSTVVFWVSAVLATVRAFWQGEMLPAGFISKINGFLRAPRLNLAIGLWTLLVLSAFALAAGFRFSRIAEIPSEMISDHAEKVLDIVDVLNGKTSIFFPRNAGREAMQFYATAAVVKWLNAEISFLTLKQVTAAAGVLTLPFIYLLGREVGGRKVGLAAMALIGIGYWPNVLGRVGMRATFYPPFLAAATYYLVRGLRSQRQNDFLLCGLALGLGVYSYTSARLAPLVIGLGVLLFLLHRHASGHRWVTLRSLGVAAFAAIVVAVPFLRVTYQVPDEVFYRTLTRVTDAEQPLAGPPLEILSANMPKALSMFSWDAGEHWMWSIASYPALDWLTGGLFHLGVVMLVVRYVKRRHWLDLFLPLSIGLLVLPSALSLAFPRENPHPSRAGGAVVPVFTIAAVTLVAVAEWGVGTFKGRTGQRIGYGFAGALFAITAINNYTLVVGRYAEQTRQSVWNASELGAIARGFGEFVGSYDQIYVVAYPHWVDSRLVAIEAGHPGDDFIIWPEQISELEPVTQARLFFLHPQDEPDRSRLIELYPNGILSHHGTEVKGREFDVFWIPPVGVDATGDDG